MLLVSLQILSLVTTINLNDHVPLLLFVLLEISETETKSLRDIYYVNAQKPEILGIGNGTKLYSWISRSRSVS